MKANEQGTREPGNKRYQAVPRTLIFITADNPARGGRDVLLLKGAPEKRLWANQYNGLGGHVEAGEDVLMAARRELREETGLDVADLTLRGVVNIDTGYDEVGQRPGVLMFVFVGHSAMRAAVATAEGAPEWIPVAALDEYPLVDDLYAVIPRALGDGPFFFGHYAPDADGRMIYRFHP